MNRWGRTIGGVCWVGLLVLGTGELHGQQKSPAELLAYKPSQPDVEYETPSPAAVTKCKVDVERRDRQYSLVLYGPEGQVLRRFTDADGDNAVEQYRYYQHGIEVYREIDVLTKGKPSQYRWLNLGGSKWGIDANKDGRIDQWKSLSAVEASREAIRAMTTGDYAALQLLMVTADDLRGLEITSSVAQKILEATSNAAAKAQAIAKKSKLFSPQYKWSRLEIQAPSVIPADEGKAAQDLLIYPNAIVMVEIPAPPGAKDFDRRNPPGLVQLGELLRVGEVWKLTQVPQPLEGDGPITTTSILMQPLLAGASEIAAPSPEMQKLIEELQKLDENPPKFDSAPSAQLASYNARRADLLMNLVSLASGPDEKAQFLKQCVDGLAAAVQTDTYPAGMKRILEIESSLVRTQPKSAVLPYVIYRRITSQYAVDMKSAKPDTQATVQKEWLDALTSFVADYPDAEDTPDAMWQLATAEEFASNQSAAISWYQKLAKAKPGTLAADKAQGALRRIALQGKGFQLNGPSLDGGPINTAQYRGKVLLVVYWATWSKLFTDDLPALRALYQQYKGKGFEVLGVCLDVPAGTLQQQKAQLTGYVRQSNIPWPQIYEPGGLDSPPAVQYGIIALPTMILIDKDGQVLSRQSSVDELKQQLPKLFGTK